MKTKSGVALVQVLVMAVLLITLTAGVMQIIFGTHVMVARAKTSDEHKMWVESCLAEKNALWDGNPCNGAAADTCSFTGGPTINIGCTGPASNRKISISVVWN